MRIYGNILLNGKFFRGTIEVVDGTVERVWERKENYDVKGTVIPTFVNMHTHLGDYYYGEEIRSSLASVVGPGGLKFKILQDEEKVREGMKKAIGIMERCGTSHFVDFREGGRRGVKILREVLRGREIRGIILGRGGVWDEADGVGLSSISDVPYDEAKRLADETRRRGKIFALHASEERRENVEKILALNPDFIVHFLQAPEEDLRKVRDREIPIVLTPRANVFWGLMPNIPNLVKLGISVSLGTDNGMVAEPCMFRELEFAYRISRLHGGIGAEEIIKMATVNPRRILGIEDNSPGRDANLIVFREIMSPYEIVVKGSAERVRMVIRRPSP